MELFRYTTLAALALLLPTASLKATQFVAVLGVHGDTVPKQSFDHVLSEPEGAFHNY
jgi:hypothetical protein